MAEIFWNIRDALELKTRAKAKVSRAKRNRNVHEDIEIIDCLLSLVEQLEEAIRSSVSKTIYRG